MKWSWPLFIVITMPFLLLIAIAFVLKEFQSPLWMKIADIVLVLAYGIVYSRLLRKLR
ncbi:MULTISPECIES: hypothetical protein [Anoxybacillaceae]|uniref:Putative membrane protein n=1 Tax=Geobacillus kaustophilus TaxID=1462 RepID=A0A0D8BNQ3_GEOKU|nr:MULTISPECIES: hypothetical protein [Bacillaceae]KJE25731.1 putative membrane protein [Geobacillus kaustophilus]